MAKEINQNLPKTDAINVPTEHFLRDIKKTMTVMENTLKLHSAEPKQLKEFTISVHTTKSLLRYIGDEEHADIAVALEQAGRTANWDIIKTVTPLLLSHITEIAGKLEKDSTKEQYEDDKVPEDKAYLNMQLEEIKNTCETYNKYGAERAIDALKQKPCSKATKRFVSELETCLSDGDFEKGVNLATEMMAN